MTKSEKLIYKLKVFSLDFCPQHTSSKENINLYVNWKRLDTFTKIHTSIAFHSDDTAQRPIFRLITNLCRFAEALDFGLI